MNIFNLITRPKAAAELNDAKVYTLLIGVEPMTFRLTAGCSNLLSYRSSLWTLWVLIPLPHACKACALPIELNAQSPRPELNW